jgi:hypothetical protein
MLVMMLWCVMTTRMAQQCLPHGKIKAHNRGPRSGRHDRSCLSVQWLRRCLDVGVGAAVVSSALSAVVNMVEHGGQMCMWTEGNDLIEDRERSH